MTGLLEGKVAFITGAARGQGRSHAVRMAEEGADVIAVDLCAQIGTVPYGMATPEDLAETVRQVEALDRRIVASTVDVRDSAGLQSALDDGVAQLGKLDVVSANAGVFSTARFEDLTDDQWDDMIGVNLTGVFRTARAAVPHLKANPDGGAMVLTSSTAGVKGIPNAAHYVAAKHGVVGLMKTLANELAPHRIRVNSLHPTTVDTDMIQNPAMYGLFRPDLGTSATREDAEAGFRTTNKLDVPWVESIDISNALVWLCSDLARYVTGVQLPVDAGNLVK
ncbi:mycofactocin-coupled SDR family oxidoreductase [Geodermatophilaceae bacterium NBWT11]|nr:mycofactocin-coupled SDR family oxidoreductase [Geodermatophilaceae bacterium NBWT11]